MGFSDDVEERKNQYRKFTMRGIKEKRSIERYFKQGYCGSEEFGKKLKGEGLKEIWSHVGRPGLSKQIKN